MDQFNELRVPLKIPLGAYKPFKRCPFCQSVFITEKKCESCDRNLLYHPIGDPLGPRSFFGIKERYLLDFNFLARYFPVFEDKNSFKAKSYIRKCEKRFLDLISAFNTAGVISSSESKLFYMESKVLLDELLIYGMDSFILESLLLDNDGSLVGQELVFYLKNQAEYLKKDKTWKEKLANYRFFGVLRAEFSFKLFIIIITVLVLSVQYRFMISSLIGK